jgi:hypothetical protein
VGLLTKLFGSAKKPAKPYVDAGVTLTHRLVASLELEGWQENGLPIYTREEADAIEKSLHDIQRKFNEEAGGEVVFYPEIVGEMQRSFAASGLQNMANQNWKWRTDFPVDWRKSVSTYLKAWTCDLNPTAMLDMARLLIKAGYKGEARDALQVVLLFPSYDPAPNSGLAAKVLQYANDALQDL